MYHSMLVTACVLRDTSRDVETAQEARCEAALDQLQRRKRKLLPIVNAAGELVSPPTTSVGFQVVCSRDACHLPVGIQGCGFHCLCNKFYLSIGTVYAHGDARGLNREAVRQAPTQPSCCWGLSVDESETSENVWLHA